MPERLTRRLAALVAIGPLLLSGCGNATGTPTPSAVAASEAPSASPSSGRPGASTSPDPASQLLDAARAEGSLTTIGLPHDWCNYGEVLSTFTARYGISVTELNPDAGFGDQIDAIKANTDKGPQAPDVIDVSELFATQAKAAKLLQPYKVATWADIPDAVKDPDGSWAGDYFGVLAFESNKAAIESSPQDWNDLLDPAHKGGVALAGDPRVNEQANQTVYASALSQPKGSLDNARPGLDFFKKLNVAGNLLPTIATPDSIANGTTPITVRWTWSALSHRDATNGSPQIDVTLPATGRLGGAYVQAISAYAPHPNAAKLWLEFVYSDEGQNLWLKGNCYPIRYAAMVQSDAIPTDVLAHVPDPSGTVFPTLAQLGKASALITASWDSVVGVDVK